MNKVVYQAEKKPWEMARANWDLGSNFFMKLSIFFSLTPIVIFAGTFFHQSNSNDADRESADCLTLRSYSSATKIAMSAIEPINVYLSCFRSGYFFSLTYGYVWFCTKMDCSQPVNQKRYLYTALTCGIG